MSNIPPSFPPRERKHGLVLLVVIVVVVIVVMGSVAVVINLRSSSMLRVGIISAPEMSNLVSEKLTTTRENNYSAFSVYGTIVKADMTIFKASNDTGFILIGSFEYSNSSSSSSFYLNMQGTPLSSLWLEYPNASIGNGSYHDFNFSYVISDYMDSYHVIIVAQSGSFDFWIVDSGVMLSSVTDLAHDEVQAMTH